MYWHINVLRGLCYAQTSIRDENQRERIFKHQERYRTVSKHHLAMMRASLEQNRKMMLAQTGTLSPAMQKFYHERLAQLSEGTKSG